MVCSLVDFLVNILELTMCFYNAVLQFYSVVLLRRFSLILLNNSIDQ